MTENYILACSHEEMNPNRRNTMEDVHRIIPKLCNDENISYFAVYDGHGGRHIVDFLEETLENNIYQELQIQDDASILDRIGRAYVMTDALSRQDNLTTSGSTAVSALIRKTNEGKFLYIANVGDSRAVLCSSHDENMNPAQTSCGYIGLRLSHDHTADDPEEQERIKNSGGFISRGRVLGILAVSRSFGDHGMKDFIIARPHLREINLNNGKYPFFILACDGLWDVITDQEAIELVLESIESNGGPYEGVAELLVETAIDRGTTDNVSAIVVFL